MKATRVTSAEVAVPAGGSRSALSRIFSPDLGEHCRTYCGVTSFVAR